MKFKRENTAIPIFSKNVTEHFEKSALAVQLVDVQTTIDTLTDTIYGLQDRIVELSNNNKFYRDKLEALGVDPDRSYAVGYANEPDTEELKAKSTKTKVKVRRCRPCRNILVELFVENTKEGIF